MSHRLGNMNNMKKGNVIETKIGQGSVELSKQVYVKPVIQCYGNLNQSIRGLSGTQFDGGTPSGDKW